MISPRRCIVIAAMTAVAAVPSTAQAMVINGGGPAPSSRAAHAVAQAPVAATTSPSGFQWDDAGLGAAGMLVILGSTSLAARLRRTHRPVTG